MQLSQNPLALPRAPLPSRCPRRPAPWTPCGKPGPSRAAGTCLGLRTQHRVFGGSTSGSPWARAWVSGGSWCVPRGSYSLRGSWCLVLPGAGPLACWLSRAFLGPWAASLPASGSAEYMDAGMGCPERGSLWKCFPRVEGMGVGLRESPVSWGERKSGSDARVRPSKASVRCLVGAGGSVAPISRGQVCCAEEGWGAATPGLGAGGTGKACGAEWELGGGAGGERCGPSLESAEVGPLPRGRLAGS